MALTTAVREGFTIRSKTPAFTCGATSTLRREHLVLAQTPQAFRTEVLREAFDAARKDGYYGTDEASLVERLGRPVSVVRGSDRNIKITRPTDLSLARFLLDEEREPVE